MSSAAGGSKSDLSKKKVIVETDGKSMPSQSEAKEEPTTTVKADKEAPSRAKAKVDPDITVADEATKDLPLPNKADATPNAMDGAATKKESIDVLFLQDTTASQGPYIQSAKSAIRSICTKISTAANMSPENMRFGLIAFRDHPPQDHSYVTRNFEFSSDIGYMETNLNSLKPQGGGDGPEAQTAALAEGLNMKWREDAAKMVVLITDAPPHGIGEGADGFEASPDQNDPLEIARQMAERGITLFVVACEPTLSRYKHAVDFYTALTQITSGKMLPLTMADRLGDYIAGVAIETIDTERLISEYSKQIVDNVYEQSKSLKEVVEEVHAHMRARGEQIKSLSVENVYVPSRKSESNIKVWKSSKNVGDSRGQIEEIEGPRMKEEYSTGRGPSTKKYAVPPEEGSRGMEEIPAFKPRGRPGPRARGPKVELRHSEVEYSHAQRVVMQSVMRDSKVTADGMSRRK